MGRYCAFKSTSGQYYVFNGTDTYLTPISFNESNPVYLDWMDPTTLNTLTIEQLSKVSNGKYFLELYSDIEDDVYSVNMSNYDILQTTDTSQFKLTGYAGINSITITGSTTCHVLLSFDGRKNWYYYDSSSNSWKKSYISKLYTSESNTVAQINALTKDKFDLIFTKHCTLDYAISINNSENVKSVVLSLPENQLPKILSINITSDSHTHKDLIKIHTHVDDMEGDNVSYKILRSFGTTVKDVLIEQGECNPRLNGEYDYYLDPKDFEIGENTITFKYTDDAHVHNEVYATQSVSIYKINEAADIVAAMNRDIITFTIIDLDSDKVRFRMLLNDEVIINTENDGWSPMLDVPIERTYRLPWDKVIFGVQNKLEIQFQDDIYDAPIQTFTINFLGQYFGLLFVDPALSDPDQQGKPNQLRYYSDSLGDVIKYLNFGSVTHSTSSQTVEVGLINSSNDTIAQAVINGFKNTQENYKIAVSKTQSFNTNLDNTTIHFDNIKPYDTSDENPDIRIFYVKLYSLDSTNWSVDNNITVDGIVDKTSTNTNSRQYS